MLLAVWEVADSAAAFYQVVDFDFVEWEGGGGRPTTPTGLKASNITDRQIRLTGMLQPALLLSRCTVLPVMAPPLLMSMFRC